MTREQAITELLAISSELRKIGELSSIASYDMTATAASGAVGRRTELIAYARALYRDKINAPRTLELVDFLSEKENYENLSDLMKGEVREYKNRLKNSEGVDPKLIEELGKLSSSTEQLWIRTRSGSQEYSEVLARIGRIVELRKEIAGQSLSFRHLPAPKHPLDPIIDQTDCGMTVERLTGFFDDIKKTSLPILQEKWKNLQQSTGDASVIGVMDAKKIIIRSLSVERQKELVNKLTDIMGYKKEYGVVGSGMHPCTYGINRYDVRFTDHFYPDNMLYAIKSATHEGGHGMYEMNVDEKLVDMLVGGPISGSIHESSSRFWEILVGHSEPFCEFLLGFIKNECPGVMDDLTPEILYRGMNQVSLEPLRIRADELTYNLHIMLRFEIEKGLFDGSIAPGEIGEVWKELSKQYLNIIPENDNYGWAQDMHWPANLFGYFQSYTMGNLYANQVNHRIRQDISDMDDLIRKGNFAPILEWLTKNWYCHGRVYEADVLMEKVTGEPLSAKYLCEHLTKKYGE